MPNTTNYIKINDVDYYDQLSASLENLTADAIVTAISDIDKKTDITSIEINIVDNDKTINIPTSAFYNCTSLTKLTLNCISNITIGTSTDTSKTGAFSSCTQLSTINIESTAANISIGRTVFYNCDNLETVVLNAKNDIMLGTGAFYHCGILNSITINADNNITIGTSADTSDNGTFSNCTQLSTINIESTAANISIGRMAFYNCARLNELDITANTIFIDEYAFDDSYTVDTSPSDRYVNIHGDEITINNRAFRSNVYLRSIEIAGIDINNNGSARLATTIVINDEYAFYNCQYLSKITILATNITIGINTFYGSCQYASSLPENIVLNIIGQNIELGSHAFYNCEHIHTVNIIGKKISIGQCAFNACTYLNTINLIGSIVTDSNFDITALTSITHIYISDTNIQLASHSTANSGVFALCYNVKHIYVNAQTISIGDSTFHSCYSYKPSTTETTKAVVVGKTIFIGKYAFNDCTYLSDIKLIGGSATDSVVDISNINTITEYNADTSIEIAAHATADYGAFALCYNLKTLNINAQTISIGTGAFHSCYVYEPSIAETTYATIIGKTISIGQYAFTACTYLRDIKIIGGNTSNSVNSVNDISKINDITEYNADTSVEIAAYATADYGVFALCYDLKTLNINAQTINIGTGAFHSCYVYKPSIVTYATIIGKTISIGQYAFNDCTYLQKINLIATGGNISIAGSDHFALGAFYNCNRLNTLNITATGDIDVGSCAFNRCFDDESTIIINGNNTVNITGNSVILGSHAFNTCKYLDEVSLIASSGKVVIYKNANAANGTFASCTRLRNFTIDCKADVEIGAYAFWNCTALEHIYFNCKPPTANANSVSTIKNNAKGIYLWKYSIEWENVIDSNNKWYGLSMEESDFTGNTGLLTIYERRDDNDTHIFGVHIDREKYNEAVSSTTDNIIAIDIPPIYVDIDNNTHVITEISSNGFTSCNQISSITIPPNITDIGVSAFAGCSGLVSIDIPESINEIKTGTFSNCTSLNHIRIPTSVSSIAVNAFANVSPTELTAVWFPGNESTGNMELNDLTSITIPDKTVELPENAFNGCTHVNYVSIPISVTTIHSNSFAGVEPETLKAAWFPGNKSAGNMLTDCLKNIIIPNEVFTINPNAFNGCTNVTSVVIPISVTDIQTNAFKEIKPIELTASWFPSEGGMIAERLTKINIHSITTLKENAFKDCINVNTIILPETVTTLNDYAFANCRNITSLNMSSVTYFGKYVFSGCTNINNIILPSNITIINDGLFKQCTSLNTISIHSNITSIGKEAFLNSGITEVTIPKTITYIGNHAFADCDKLTHATIPNNINIAENAFDGSNNITQLTASYIPYGMGSQNLTNVIIPSDTNIIKADAFSTRNNTKTLVFDFTNCNSIPKLASEKAFNNDANDNYILVVPNKLFANWVFAENWEKLYNNTLSEAEQTYISNNYEKTVIYYNNDTTVIQDYYSQEISSSEESAQLLSDEPIVINIENAENAILIFLEKGITTIPNISTLNENTNIAAVGSFDVTNIPEKAFYNCRSLAIVKSYNNTNITNIADKAFYNCDKLLYVDGINTVLTIGDFAFYNCTALKTLSNFIKLHNIGKYAFYNCVSLLEFNINYADNDEQIADISIQEPSVEQLMLEVINEYTFANCTSLTNVNIPENVTKIKERAFYNCKNLKDILDISKVNDVGIGAFSHCELLPSDTINALINNIVIINDFSFENCNEIVELNIPESITKIGNYAFSDCANLIKVKLNCDYDPNDIIKISNYIGINAFAGCVKLATLDLSGDVLPEGDLFGGFTADEARASILPIQNTSGYSGLVITNDDDYISNPKSFSSYPVLYAPFAQSIREVVYDILSGYTLALDSFNDKFLPLAGCDKNNVKSQMKGDIIFNNNDQSLVGIGIDSNNSNKNNLTLTYYNTNDVENSTVNFSVNTATYDSKFNITVNGMSTNVDNTHDILDEDVFGSDITINTNTIGSTQLVSKTLSISTDNTLSWSGNTLSLNGINLTNDNGSLKWNNRHIHISERHIGEVFYTYRYDALTNGNINGAYVCNGQTIEVPSTAKIIELLNSNLIPHVSFTSTITFNNIGYFGYTENAGSLTQKIRIPNLMNDNLIIQAMTNSNIANTIGNTVSAGLPNIDLLLRLDGSGNGLLDYIQNEPEYGNTDPYGVMSFSTSNNDELVFNMSKITILTNKPGDLSMNRNIYGKSNTVQPNAVRLLPLVQILDALELPILE